MKKDKQNTKNNHSTHILDCRIDALAKTQFINQIDIYLTSNKQHILVTPNPEIILLAQNNQELKTIINDSDLSLPDGVGLQWASAYLSLPIVKNKYLGSLQSFIQLFLSFFTFVISSKFASSVIPERVTGTDFVIDIVHVCIIQNKSIYFLGAGPGVAEMTAKNLKKKYPKLKIAGYSSLDWLPQYEKEIIDNINQAKADCLLVAYGAPRQEQWISRNITFLPSIKLVIGIGGAFDFIAGAKSVLGGPPATRASFFWRNHKLEWLHRIFTQPNRIGRILRATVIFPIKVFLSKIKQ